MSKPCEELLREYRRRYGDYLPHEQRQLDEAYAVDAVNRAARVRICDSLEEALAANGSGQFMAMVKDRKALETRKRRWML